MHIRPVNERDFDHIAALSNRFIRDTHIHFGYHETTSAEQRAAWESARARFPFLVLEIDGRFAGYAKAGTWRAREAYDWTCETGIYLEDWARGRGLGRVLYAELLRILRAQGFRSAIGGIALPNDASVRLHESLGFQHVGTVPDAGFKHGQWHAVGFWQILLDGRPGAPTPTSPPDSIA